MHWNQQWQACLSFEWHFDGQRDQNFDRVRDLNLKTHRSTKIIRGTVQRACEALLTLGQGVDATRLKRHLICPCQTFTILGQARQPNLLSMGVLLLQIVQFRSGRSLHVCQG